MLDLFKLQLGQTQTPLLNGMALCVQREADRRREDGIHCRLCLEGDAHVERDGVHENGLAVNTAYHARVFRSRIWPPLTLTCQYHRFL